ncbi:hypothetical protein SLV14_005655 [Streptomyces sp. Je 1-4]|uniref:hypothetical protein n=1 Tax=Streptomyces TaxID=1883 RepID=UPI00140E9853|nr:MULTISPECIES: hypothetical protein [unclassified Streptomyces]QIK09053.1 hypothetical protein G7Z12_26565 [Streptomyces sp. ID38640]UYB42748.1 hypothetical protein SLV14_005655 [Streptomyces sp. Je 1-4]UZQ39078.1 hypothetical protein SLV14N_005655 [Streptomyces sp. Je 1-4] [Streptomyces sp. Je 1-4 4N24]UZQ46495.1 hypothetical protein SLV14NA_005655 [Streptomyces sp. Je 1-4] [Streptomyces sp. Je 1-4 4N24_ara]
MTAFELGEPVDEARLEKNPPPVVIEAQPDSFIRLETPEELRAWEKAVRQTTGLEMSGSDLRAVGTEGCSCGCSDKSDVCQQ